MLQFIWLLNHRFHLNKKRIIYYNESKAFVRKNRFVKFLCLTLDLTDAVGAAVLYLLDTCYGTVASIAKQLSDFFQSQMPKAANSKINYYL